MKFSVLLPTHNRLDLLQLAVQSVLRQDLADWEIIISDNYSEENVGVYVQSLGDARIRYYRTDSFVSVTQNWNNALAYASGNYVIMLGDDDALMPDFFRTATNLIERYQQPDFIYTDAYVFGYPGVLPEFPDGAVRYGYNNYFQDTKPFLLDQPTALAIARDALDLKFPVMYNMQLSILRLDFIQSLARQGDFFQSPFPDFYATVVSFLKSKRTLIYQQPIVTIGVSKKSYGFNFFNKQEQAGEKFLNNLGEQEAAHLDSILIPGSWTLNCQLLAMEMVRVNYSNEFPDLMPDYKRYRQLQIRSNYRNRYLENILSADDFATALSYLTFSERLIFNILYRVPFTLLKLLGEKQTATILTLIRRLLGRSTMYNKVLWKPARFKTILEVTENLPTQHPSIPKD